MTATVSLNAAAGTTRPSGASLATLTGIEIRKSLSTRSGKAVAVVAVLLGPAAVAVGSLGGDGTAPGAIILGFTGMLTALVLLALGVLSTAGEWTHKSVQTTYLLVPRRGRVLTSKVSALVLMGAALAAVDGALSTAMLWVIPDPVTWTGIGRSFLVVVAAGAAFAVVGAGIGAALGNSPAALTGTYLTMLGVMPILAVFKPAWSEKLDPVSSIVNLAQGHSTTTPALVITGWVVVATVAGAVITRRRAVS
jgi:ABC-2 type transport system permease protein